MTTIAFNYKDKEIAVDSRFTRGDMISTDKAVKSKTVKGITFVFAGLSGNYNDLVDMWFNNEPVEGIGCPAFVIDSGVVYDYGIDCDGKISKEAIDENLSKGSGEIWALSAMDFGCSAKDAVKYAMTRDIYTGGTVKVIKVK